MRQQLGRRHRLLAALVALATVGLAAGTASATVSSREVSKKVKVQGTALPESADQPSADDPAIGMTAPTLVGQGYDGQKVTFADDGKARILIFLSHSCPHCQAEVPRIVKLAGQGKLDAVEIDTVTTNTSKDLPNYPPSKWLKKEKWPFSPVLADDGRLRAFFGFGGQAFPFFVFVGADGKVAARVSGELEPATIAKAAARLAAGESLFAE